MIDARVKDGEMSLFMPLTLKKRRGRKMVLVPKGVQPSATDACINMPLLKALVRAHLWRQQIESGRYTTLQELSEHHGIKKDYIQELLHLNYLAPKIKEAILNGTQPRDLRLSDLMHHVPLSWQEQEEKFGFRVVDGSDFIRKNPKITR